MIDSRLIEAVRVQLAERRRLLDKGTRHVGWKLGMGDRESIGGHIAIGYLTSDSVLDSGSTYTAAEGAELHADAEACVELAGPEEIGAYGVALEIVDLAPLPGEPERDRGPWPHDIRERITALGEILGAAGEQLRRGDRMITGSIVQVPITPGDRVAAVIGEEVAVTLDISNGNRKGAPWSSSR